MSKPKYKITGFAKFFAFMLFFIPISFVAASIIQGRDPILASKELKEKGMSILKKGFVINSEVQDDNDFQKTLLEKDAEIQELREKLFICGQTKK